MVVGGYFRMQQGQPLTRNEVLGVLVRLTVLGAITYFSIKWLVKAIDPTRQQKLEAQKQAEKIMKKMGIKNVKLTEYELAIAAHLVDPTTVTVSWDDIAGLEDVIAELRETVILPIQRRDLFTGSQLIKPPKGVLLHGPPGCGKTLIAKATAREAGARFINLEVSSLMDKWYGESQKLAAAVFSLAVKVQPTIIFIDEIDSFLRNRMAQDHEATAMMKAQFMSLWDGLITDNSVQVIVMGATNRPQDVDRAILRRMPSMFHIGLPNLQQRRAILRLILLNEGISDDVDFHRLAQLANNFSGSDLRELCRNAAICRIRDFVTVEQKRKEMVKSSSKDGNESQDEEEFHDALRPITMEDFTNALTKMRISKLETGVTVSSGLADLE